MTNDIQENNSKDILFDEQLEQQILGCILIENKVLQYIELDLNEDSFYYNDYKIIFNTIKKLLQNNQPADEKTLFYTLADSDFTYQGDELKQFISSLIESGISMITTPKESVKILNYLSLKRELLSLNQEINNIVHSGSNIENIENKIGDIEQKFYKITDKENKKESYNHLGKYTEILKNKLDKARASNKDIQGIKTGLKDKEHVQDI